MHASRSQRYDVVVVGAGVVGLACAWEAARRGRSVLAAERWQPGAGASGVAAGMLAPVTEADFGEDELLSLNLASRAKWGVFASELASAAGGADPGYVDSGALVVAADRDDAEELRRLHAYQRELGLDAEWLVPSAARALEPGISPRVAGAIHTPGDGYADPPALVAALARALEHEGGELISGVEVTAVDREHDRVTGVRTAAGRVEADSVVLAGGAWSATGAVEGIEAVPVRPLKGQILELRAREGRPPPATRLVRTPRCYLVCRPDGRVAVGATSEERGFDPAVTAGGIFGLLEAAREVLPDVDELELVSARTSFRPATPDNRPLVGPGEADGLIWATGHGRNGVLLAPLTATAVADILDGGSPGPFAACAPDRFGVVAG